MSACIPTYMLASGPIGSGLNWSQAVFTIFLGHVIIVIPMILNAHAGTRYGIPFPVLCRASFGTIGANVPALVACGWVGIRTWIGGAAIYQILGVFADPSGYILTWLVGYSALLGPIGGIMIADYFVIRGRCLNVLGLYKPEGDYCYRNGISYVAPAALVAGILPSLPGFLATIHVIDAPHVAPFLLTLYSYAWFVGFGISFALYIALRKLAPNG